MVVAPDLKSLVPAKDVVQRTIRDYPIELSGDAGWPQDVESYPYRELACDNPAGAPTVPRSVSTSNNNSYDWSARSTASSRRSYSRGDKRCPRTSTRCQVLFVMLLPPIRRRHAAGRWGTRMRAGPVSLEVLGAAV